MGRATMRYFKNTDNEVFGYSEDQQDLIDQALSENWQEITGSWPPAYIAQIPQVVSKFQSRAALAQAGLLEQVQTYMDAQPADSLARIAWEHGQEFRRQSPNVLQIGAALGMTEADLDALFVAAATIEA